jgi:hypothetical protein
MRPVSFQLGPYAAASAASLLTATTVGAAGALTLTGTTLDVARRLLFTSSGTDSGLQFTVIGTDASNNKVVEVVTGGVSGTAARTVMDYKTLVSIAASGATAGTLSIGTALSGGVASSPWVRLDDWVPPGSLGVAAIVSAGVGGGTINYTLQYSQDDPNSVTNPVNPYQMTWFNTGTAALITATASQFSTEAVTTAFARILVNSYTSAAQVTGTIRQLGAIS